MDTLEVTYEWFAKAVPNPAPKNFTTQLGVHFEEVSEMVVELVPVDQTTGDHIVNALTALKALADHLKTNEGCVTIKDRTEYLDSICDQIVTATGCAYMEKMDILGAMCEVNDSNYSKFDAFGDPIFDPNMKVVKGPDYFKANLEQYT